jgi:hypothetical protein
MGHLKASSGWRVWPVVATNASGADGFGWHEEEDAVHTSVRGKRENVLVIGVFKNRKHIWPTGLGEGDGGLQRECEPVWPGWAC